MSFSTRTRHAHLWGLPYILDRLRALRAAASSRPAHILFAIADHYEPDFGNPSASVAMDRVRRWQNDYPKMASGLVDADGRPPRHTFFYPAETYEPSHLEGLRELVEQGFGEVEVHLHHDNDTSDGVRKTLEGFRDTLASRHGLLSRDSDGRTRYAFVHGNWALDNSRADGRFCGVNDEIDILIQTGCYADLTMPAVPDSSQSRMVNTIYYAVDDPCRPRSHDRGTRVAVGGSAPANSLLMIQGPLGLAWSTGGAFRPTLENGAIDRSVGHHPTLERFGRWLRAGVSVAGREDWIVVKIYTHGAPEPNADVLLGPVMRRFHEEILHHFNDGIRWQLHYVTARELANIVLAAEAGERGNPGEYRDYRYRRA